MVASSPPEPSANDYAALAQRLDDMQRQIDEAGRASKFPFVVSHGSVADFQIVRSVSGDGSADILIGNGAGGKLIQVKTDSTYGSKILLLLDQQGTVMMSTDAFAGYGLGVPSYPFPYAGYESNTLSGAVDQSSAREYARGSNFVYNPATFVQPRVRLFSTTAETVKLFAQWRDAQGNLNNTSDVTINLAANVATAAGTYQYGKLWDANDMNGVCKVFLKAYCVSGIPANVNITGSFQDGYGVSKRFYIDNSPSWAV